MENLTRNPNLSSELGYTIKMSRKIAEICREISLNFHSFYYVIFHFTKKKFCFSAGLLFFPYSQPLEIPRKMGFGSVPLKQHRRKCEKTR